MKPERLAELETKDISNLLQTATTLGYKNVPVLRTILKELVKPERLMKMEAIELQETMLGMGRCSTLIR